MIAGIVIGSIIGAIALILCIPIHASFEVKAEETLRFRFGIRWLFGAFKRQVSRGAAGGVAAKGRPISRRGWSNLLPGFLSDSELRSRLGKLISVVVRSGEVESLEADFKVGLDDPADTALIFGPTGAASVLLNLHTGHNIWLLPALEGETLEGYLSARFRWLPIRLVRPIMSLLSSKSGRKIAKLAVLRR